MGGCFIHHHIIFSQELQTFGFLALLEQMMKLRGVGILTQDLGLVSGRSRLQANVLITLTTLHSAALHHGLEDLVYVFQRGNGKDQTKTPNVPKY